MPASVVAILAANLAGRCPHLGADWRCGLYEHRPLVCRIYPAEINPFVELDPARKACPPEAWTAGHPLLSVRGRLSDSDALADIERSRDADRRDVATKRSLCTLLQIRTAALAGEGFVVHSPEPATLLGALRRAAGGPDMGMPDGPWQFISDQADSVSSLRSGGALASHSGSDAAPAYEYLGFR
jgi:Putative zinc- or iron-chelating domain